MAKGGSLTVRVIGDTKPLEQSLDGIGGKLGKFAGAAVLAGGVAAVALGTKAVMAASDLNETVSQTGVVFGDSSGIILKQADSMADRFGVVKQEFIGGANNLGLLAQGAGYAADAAAKLGADFATLATDASSFYNVPVGQALEDIRSGLSGESEPLKKYGILLSEAAVKAKAMELGLAGAGGALDEKAKMEARAALITEGFAKANGDLERTQDSVANQWRKLTGDATNFAAEVGTRLLPAVQGALGFLGDLGDAFKEGGLGGAVEFIGQKLGEVGPKVAEFLGSLVTRLQEAAPEIAAKVGEWAGAFLGWVAEVAPPLLTKLGELLGALGKWIVDDALPAISGQLREWAAAYYEWVAEAVPPLIDKLGDLLRQVGSWLLGTALPKIVGELKKWADSFVEWVGPAVRELLPELGGLLGKLVNWLVTDALPKIIVNLVKWAGAFLDWVVTGVIPELPGVLLGILEGIVRFVGEAVGSIDNKLLEWAGSFIGWVGDAIANLPGKLAEFAGKLLDWIRSMPGKIREAAAGLWDGLKDAFKSAINWIIQKWNNLSLRIGGQTVSLPFGQSFTIPTITLNTPNVPLLHSGGVFRAPPGQREGLALLRDRERVLTPEQDRALTMGRSSGMVTPSPAPPGRPTIQVTNYITVGPGADPVKAGQEIVAVIKQYERAAGTGWRAA